MKIPNSLCHVCLASLMLLTEMWMCCYCFLTLPTTWPSKLLFDLKLLIFFKASVSFFFRIYNGIQETGLVTNFIKLHWTPLPYVTYITLKIWL